MPLALKSLVALVLLAGFPLVAVAVAAVGVGVAVTDHAAPRLGSWIVCAGLGVFVALGTSLVRALLTRPEPVAGPQLTRRDAGALWHLVDDLSARMQVEGPRRIVVVPDVNAAVHEVAGRRELLLGLPLLVALPCRELASVLAHELGHHCHGHTRMSARTYRWSAFVLGLLDRTPNRFARWVLSGYCRLYLVFARSANRAHELQADDWSARLTDPLTAAAAIERLGAVGRCWDILTQGYLPLTGPARRRASLADGLNHLLQERPEGRPGVTAPGAAPSRFDTHPPAHERAARFRRIAADAPQAGTVAPPPDAVPAWTLLDDPGATLDELEHLLLGDDDPRAPWDEVVRLAGQVESEHLAATATRGLTAPTVGDVLTAFADGRPVDVVLPLVRGDLDEAGLARAVPLVGADVLAAVVHLSLAADGRARYALSWSGPRRWLVWHGEELGWQDVDLPGLVTPAASDPGQAAVLVSTLRSWGARLDLPLKADGAPDREAEGALGRGGRAGEENGATIKVGDPLDRLRAMRDHR